MFQTSLTVSRAVSPVLYLVDGRSTFDALLEPALSLCAPLSTRNSKFSENVLHGFVVHVVEPRDIRQAMLLLPVQARQKPLIARNDNSVVSWLTWHGFVIHGAR